MTIKLEIELGQDASRIGADFSRVIALLERIAAAPPQRQGINSAGEAPKAPTSTPRQPADLLTEIEVAHRLAISVATVRRWRLLKAGPPFLKIGAHVRYQESAIFLWLDRCRVGDAG